MTEGARDSHVSAAELEALRASEAQKTAIITSAMDAIVAADDQGRITEFNAAAESLFGYRRADVIGRRVGEVLVPENMREHHELGLRRCAESGEQRLAGQRVELEALRSDGTTVQIEAGFTAAKVGEHWHFTAFMRDISEKKKGERERERLAQLLQDAIEGVPDGFAVYGPDERLATCNKAFAALYQATPAELVGREAIEMHRFALSQTVSIDGEAIEDPETGLDRAMAKFRAADRKRLEIELKDGRWLLLGYHPTSDGGVALMRTDITSLKQAEATLRESEQRLRSILEAQPLPLIIVGLDDAEVLFASPSTAEMYGRSLFEIVGSNATRLYDDETALRRFIADLRRDGAVEAMEVRTVHASGRVIWTLISGRPIEYEGEEAIVVGIFDLSERKAAEEALKASAARQKMILDNIPARVAFLDAERRHRYVNKRYLELLDLPIEEVIGRTVNETLGEETGEVLRPLAERALAGEVVQWQGWMNYPKRGERFVIRAYTPNIGADGTVDGYFAFSQDFTEQKLAEQEVERQREALHQSEKMSALGSLLAGVAHELNNPLSVVVGQAMMMEETAPDPKTATRASKIRTAAERCARIVKTFLAMARQRQPERGPVRLNALVESAVELLGYGLRTADIELKLDLGADLPETWAEENLLGQVVTNLIVNAQQALEGTESPRRLLIATSFDAEASMLRLRIADSGPGIPADIRPRIFEPFFTTKPVGSGTGIGLSVCHGIVASHGGTIEIGEGLDGGAAFEVSLPFQPLESDAEQAAAPAPAVGGRSILVVDDEPFIAEILAEFLNADGHRVEIAASGREALEKLGGAEYDLIVSDMRMPDIDGPALYRRLESEHPRYLERIVFITGDTLGLGIGKFIEESGRPCIEKPFTPEDVRAAVEEVLATAKSVEQAR